MMDIKVEVNGFYRPNNEAAPADHLQENVDGYLYATGAADVALQVLRGNVTSITAAHQSMDNGEYINVIKSQLEDEDNNLTFGIKCEQQRRQFSWTMVDDFRVFYSANDENLFLEDYNNALAAAQAVDTEAPMNANERQDLLDAIAADATLNKANAAVVQDATSTLTLATTVCINSINAYAQAKVAIERLQAIMESTNMATAEAIATFEGYETAYTQGTLSDEDAAAMERRMFRDREDHAENFIDDYLLSAWTEGDTQMANYTGKLYINTWSTEADVPGFTYPFYEFADGWPGSTVAHTFTATKEGLTPGEYAVTMWIRTQTNNEGGIGEPQGVTLQANDGEAVSVSGEVSGRFRAGEYTATGTVGADGKLVLTLSIAENAAAGLWLSFRDVHISPIELANVTINENTTFVPQAQKANVELTRSFNATGWNTLVLPFDVKNATDVFGEDVKVAKYTGATVDDAFALNFETTDIIKANEPVFIYGVSKAAPYEFNAVNIVEADPILADANVDFIGIYEASMSVPSGSYYIAKDNTFRRVGTGNVTLKGTRAYFKPNSAEVKEMLFVVDGTETRINSINSEATSGAYYSVQGVKVTQPRKGVYIHNGNKVLVK